MGQRRISISSDHTGLELTQHGDPDMIPALWYAGKAPWAVADSWTPFGSVQDTAK